MSSSAAQTQVLACACEKVTRSFPGIAKPVLSQVNLAVKPGESLAITGASGSGKTTLLNILGLLDTASSGDVFIDGVPVSSLSQKQRRQVRANRLGFVFQDAMLDPERTAVENIEVALRYAGVPRTERRNIAMGVLTTVNLEHRAHARAPLLSGGERQRVAIARAMAHKPSVLLCDEPTGALDDDNSRTVLGLIRQMQSTGCAVVVVTHDMSIPATLDRHVVLRGGRAYEQ